MSKYTTELRFIVEQGLQSRLADNIEANWPLIYSAQPFLSPDDPRKIPA